MTQFIFAKCLYVGPHQVQCLTRRLDQDLSVAFRPHFETGRAGNQRSPQSTNFNRHHLLFSQSVH